MAQATFVQEGWTIDYTPNADVASGDVFVLGSLIGVAKLDIKSGKLGALTVEGIFDFAKAAGAGVTFAVGALAYWDDTNNVAVATDGTGANKLLGKVVKAAADADGTVRVKLNQ